jgi:hypothetical protein
MMEGQDPRQIIAPALAKPDLVPGGEHHPDNAGPDVHENPALSPDVAPQARPEEPKMPAEPPIPSTIAQVECSMCEGTFPKDLWFCGVCKVAYCDRCWEMQGPHRVKSKALLVTPHVKTPLDIAEKVGKVLTPTDDAQQQEALHREDENTAWFGKQ